MTRQRWLGRIVVPIGAGFAIACGGSDTSPPKAASPVLTSLAVALSDATITVGQTTTATVTGKDQFGTAAAPGSVTWSSSSSTIATVNGGGLVSGVAAGQANITATSGAITGSASLTVQPPVNSVAECKLPAKFTDTGLGFPRIANRLKSVGDVHVSVVFVDFPDAVATRTPQSVFAILSPGAENFYKAVSYGRMNLILDATYTWRRMTKASTQYGWPSLTFTAHRAYIQEAVNLASPAEFTQADAVAIIANPDATALTNGPTLVAPAGLGVTAGAKTFLNAITSGNDLLGWGNYWLNHEMGHMMSLVDLYAFSGTTHRFVGNFSIMGLISGFAREYFGWERWLLGWIDDDQVKCAPAGTTDVVLSPVERSGGTKMVVIPTGTTTAIVAESRRAEGYDTNGSWVPGVLVYSIDTSIPSGNGVLHVLPLNDTDTAKRNAPLQPGASITVGSVTVTFTSTDANGDHLRVTR